jgi:hypothetical protein
LAGKNLIGGEFLNLIYALGKLVKKQDQDSRQKKVIPSLLELLKEAYYLTPEAADWAEKEVVIRKEPLEQLLVNNYLVAGQTIENAAFAVDTLKKAIHKAKIF